MKFSIYDEVTKKFLSSSNVCLHCGKKLKDDEIGYCSFECYKATPPNYAMIEKEQNKKIDDVLLELLNKGYNVVDVAKELDISHTALYRYLNKNKFTKKSMWVIENGGGV